MLLVKRFAALAPLVLVSACMSYAIDAPQTREEFVTRMKGGGFMKDTETLTVSRPFKTVVADLKAYSEQCLNITKRTYGNYQTKSNGSITWYHAQVDADTAGVARLTLQGEQPRMKGQPTGGLFKLVAEARGGKGGTRIDLYYIGTHDFVAEQLKLWANGNRGKCPEFT
jgi:hypothetical protein